MMQSYFTNAMRLCQPIMMHWTPHTQCTAISDTVASYVKWVEAAGARVALLQYNGTAAMLASAFRQLSGLVVPGGHCGFHTTSYG